MSASHYKSIHFLSTSSISSHPFLACALSAQLVEALGSLLIEAHLVIKRDEVKRLTGRSKEDIRDYYIPFI